MRRIETTNEPSVPLIAWFAVAIGLLIAASFVAKEYRYSTATRNVTGKIIFVDHLNTQTLVELQDGQRVIKVGRWGEVGDEIGVRVYCRNGEAVE